jgi:hypothetical protein
MSNPDPNEAYDVVPMKVEPHGSTFAKPQGRGRTLRHRPGAPRSAAKKKAYEK